MRGRPLICISYGNASGTDQTELCSGQSKTSDRNIEMKKQHPETSRRKVLFSLGVSGVFYLLLCILSSSILPGASKITLTVETNHPDTFQLFYWNGLRKIEFQEGYSVRSSELKEGTKSEVIFKMDNASVNKVRLDTGEAEGVVKLYTITVKSHFAKAAEYTPADIYDLFKPGNDGTILRLHKDYVEVSSRDNDPFIVSDRPLLKANFFLLYGVPFLLAGIFYVLLLRFDAGSFPAFSDIAIKKPTSGVNVDSLDGLRGLAAIFVVADHTWGRFTGMGAGGVWIFMALSGFLLARPFVSQPARVLSGNYLVNFFTRRVKRVVPIYYFYIILVYVLTERFDLAIRHFLFLQGNGHLWVIPQEMFFYLLVPFIMVINYLLWCWKKWLVPVNLVLLILLANQFLNSEVISLFGMYYKHLRPYVGIFLSGVLSSYLYYGYYNVSGYQDQLGRKGNVFFSLLGIALLLFFLLGSTGYLWGNKIVYAQFYYKWFGVAAGVLLFSVMAAGNSLLTRVLSFLPLRAIGLVSLSLYLFHPMVIPIIRKSVSHYGGYHNASGLPLFAITLLVSYCVACVLYTYIERPILRS